MRRAIYYHVSNMGNWREVVAEQLRLLRGCPHPVRIGFSGPKDESGYIYHVATALGLNFEIMFTDSWTGNFEFPTLARLWDACKAGTVDQVAYFHTKGVSRVGCWHTTLWRWIMNAHVVAGWRKAFDALEGHAWAAPVLSGGLGDSLIHSCGNFWTAQASHIAGLPSIPAFRDGWPRYQHVRRIPDWCEERHAAEVWIGSNAGHLKQLHADKDCDISNAKFWIRRADMQQWAYLHGCVGDPIPEIL